MQGFCNTPMILWILSMATLSWKLLSPVHRGSGEVRRESRCLCRGAEAAQQMGCLVNVHAVREEMVCLYGQEVWGSIKAFGLTGFPTPVLTGPSMNAAWLALTSHVNRSTLWSGCIFPPQIKLELHKWLMLGLMWHGFLCQFVWNNWIIKKRCWI